MSNSISKMVKEKFDCICKRTGMYPGYSNDWFLFCKNRMDNLGKLFDYDTEKLYEYLKSRKVCFKRYEEKYPPDMYEDVITEKNRKRVKFIDKIVDELNSMLQDYSLFDYKRFKTLTERAIILIHGESFEAHEKRRCIDEMEIINKK